MKDFESLQNVWEEQLDPEKQTTATDLIKKAKAHTKTIKRKHFWTIAVLLVTLFIIVAYFIWINFYGLNFFTIGLGLMMGMLLIRIVLEFISIRKFKKIAIGTSFEDYSQLVVKYYHWRKKIHYVFTPVIYFSYFIGFALILPILKDNLSKDFYNYVLISGIVIFIGLALFIYKQIKRELDLIKYLKSLKV